MGLNEFEIIIRLVDRLIEMSEPRLAEYYRGYGDGIRLRRLWGQSLETFYRYEAYKDIGDPYLDNYVRGFNHGCTGVIPGSVSTLLQELRAS